MCEFVKTHSGRCGVFSAFKTNKQMSTLSAVSLQIISRVSRPPAPDGGKVIPNLLTHHEICVNIISQSEGGIMPVWPIRRRG